MGEVDWVASLAPRLEKEIQRTDQSLAIETAQRLAYSLEIRSYGRTNQQSLMSYQTDLLIRETSEDGSWKPRLIVEVKVESVSTHDAITYSQKAAAHKNLHPYLRYGFLIGGNKEFSLPGRLIRHGLEFDFMISWPSLEPSDAEVLSLAKLILDEVAASRSLESIVFDTRAKDRDRYVFLHRPLVLTKG